MNKSLPTSHVNGFVHVTRSFATVLGVLFCLFFSTTTQAQVPGNPFVDAGPDQTIDCNSGGCTDISAIFLEIGETTTYNVSSILYNPPSDFTGLGNQLNPDIDDRWTAVQQLPFDFCFFGDFNLNYQVGTNGVIAFEQTATLFNDWSFNVDLPNNSDPALGEANIFSPTHDMDPTRSQFEEIGFEIQGVAPNRVLVVAFAEVPMFQCNNILATQMIVLYETTNIVDIYIKTKPACPTWNGGNAVVGIQNNEGTVAFVPPGRQTSDSPWEAINEAWRFTPAGPSIVDFAWLDSAGTVIGNTATLNVCPSGTATYTAQVTYTSCNGDIVVVEDDVTITSNASFTVDAGPDVASCTATSAVLTANLSGINPGDATFLWSTGATTQSITVNTSGTYTVAVTGNGCTITDSVNVDFNATPIIELGNTINSCLEIGNTIVLDATPSNVPVASVTFVWRLDGTILPGETNATLIPTATGTYSVTVTNGTCVSTDTIMINPVAYTVELGPDFSSCLIDPQTLTATLTVYAANQVTFEWLLDGNVLAGETSQTLTITQTGTYTVNVSAGVCDQSDTIIVAPGEDILVELGPDFDSCFAQPEILDASPSNYDPTIATYQWFLDGVLIAGETNPTITVNQNGTYMVIVTIGGCETTDTIVIGNAGFEVSIGDDLQSCFEEAVILTATITVFNPSDATFQWFLDGVLLVGETNQTLTATQPGTYQVIANVDACESTDSIDIIDGDLTVTLGEDINSCFENGSETLTATITGYDESQATFQWFLNGTEIAGETASTLVITETGTYMVTVTVGTCIASDTIIVGTGDLMVDLGPDFTSCFENNTETLTATVTGYDASQAVFEWTLNGVVLVGEISATLDITGIGTYTVTVTVGNCTATDTIVISLSDFTVSLGNDFDSCFDANTTLTATLTVYDPSEATFEWFLNGEAIAGETGVSIPINQPGEYTVIASVGLCTAQDIIVVGASDPLIVTLGADFETCPNDANIITASTSELGVTYQWFLNGDLLPNETGSSITISVPENAVGAQTYTVVITSGQCSGTDSIAVSLYGSGGCVISQGISPNGSPGMNDVLDLTFLSNRTGISNLQIINRLGKVVYEKTTYTNEWRGQTDDGTDLPTGTYYYVINFEGEDPIYGTQATGWIYVNQNAN